MTLESLADYLNKTGQSEAWNAKLPSCRIDGRLLAPYLVLSARVRPHLFLTIGLDREKSPDSLYQQIQALTPRVTQLIGAVGVMEFVPHPHVHILMDKPERYHKGNLIKVIARALDISRLTLIDIQIGSKGSDYRSRLEYIQGDKKDEEKVARVEADASVREAFSIPHLINF